MDEDVEPSDCYDCSLAPITVKEGLDFDMCTVSNFESERRLL